MVGVNTLLDVFMLLLIIGYIVINFMADLPRFLIGENVLLAVTYSILLYLINKNYNNVWYFLTSVIAAFNAGRVSRSIVTPRGEKGELALEHVPLLTIILLILFLSFYIGYINM